MKGAPVQVKEGIEENRECFQSSVTHEPARGGRREFVAPRMAPIQSTHLSSSVEGSSSSMTKKT